MGWEVLPPPPPPPRPLKKGPSFVPVSVSLVTVSLWWKYLVSLHIWLPVHHLRNNWRYTGWLDCWPAKTTSRYLEHRIIWSSNLIVYSLNIAHGFLFPQLSGLSFRFVLLHFGVHVYHANSAYQAHLKMYDANYKYTSALGFKEKSLCFCLPSEDLQQ